MAVQHDRRGYVQSALLSRTQSSCGARRWKVMVIFLDSTGGGRAPSSSAHPPFRRGQHSAKERSKRASEPKTGLRTAHFVSVGLNLPFLALLRDPPGQTGLGKSTLINTIFASHLIDTKGRFEPDELVRQTTEIQAVSHLVQENAVRLRLNIVDTPGYGDLVNNENCWEPIIKYIKDQHSAYLRKELTAMRDKHIADTRIHACLYFIAPTGHTLKAIDVVVMKKLSEVVNVIPVIAKSDSLTLEEREMFKERIRAELQYHNIRAYPFDTEENDDEERQLNEAIRNMIPFAVVGSERNVIVDGKPVRGRKNRWGVINVENEQHCEFNYLRNFLTRTHLQDLIETTAQIHYEAFRSKQLLALKESSASKQQAQAQQNGV